MDKNNTKMESLTGNENKIIRKDGKPYTLKADKNRFFFPEEYVKFEEQLKDKQLHTVKCLLNTGARINEMRNVLVEDINFGDKWIILRITKTKARKGEKKGQPRYIKISKQFTYYLRRYVNDNGLLRHNNLNILSTPAMNTAMKLAAKRAGLKNPGDFSPHTLRKTMETWLMALDINDMKIVKHLGHDLRTAVSNYVSPDIFSVKQKLMMRTIIGDLYG